MYLAGPRRNGRPSIGRARRETSRRGNRETKSWRQEIRAHLGMQGDGCAWSVKEEGSEKIKTRGRKLSQIGKTCEEQAKEILLCFMVGGTNQRE